MLSKYIEITGIGEARCASETIDASNLRADEAIIEAEASMISAGTELSRVFAIKKGFSYPVRPGYSAVGIVRAKSDGLPDIALGDRVFYTGPHASICRFRRGNVTQGPMIFRLPNGIAPLHGALITCGLVAMSGVCAAEVKPGDCAALFGLGSIGLFAARMLQRMGVRVIAFDTVAARCETAKALGIKESHPCEAQGQLETLMGATGGRGADIVVDVTGSAAAIMTAIGCAATYGQVILLGTPRADHTANVTPAFNAIHMRMLRVIGAFNSLYPPQPAEGQRISVARNFQTVCEMLCDGGVDAARMISHVIAPDAIQEAYHGLMYDRDHYDCAVIDWTR